MRSLECVIPTLTLVTAIFSAGCEDPDADRPASAIARLGALGAATVADLVARDVRCGFDSAAVKDAVVLRGETGEVGAAEWAVVDCAIDLTEPRQTNDCAGVEQLAAGRLVVTATMRLSGILTGDPENPVLPTSPDALSIELHGVAVRGFTVVRSDRTESLTLREGGFSAVVRPRLATEVETGACALPTPNTSVEGLRFQNVNVFLDGGEASGYAFVPESDLSAQIGATSAGENRISGSLFMFTREVPIPHEGDEGLFDDGYDPSAFVASYACNEGLKQPVAFECAFASDDLAMGISRLTIQNLAAISALLDQDSTCGFQSPNVLATAELEGEVGRLGELVLRTERCAIEPAEAVIVSEDCRGARVRASGRFTATATRRIRGRLTGDLFAPIIPTADDGASLVLEEVILDGFRVESDLSSGVLTQLSGTLTATVTPRVAARASDGACDVPTPIARFDGVRYRDAVLRLESSEVTIAVPVPGSELRAVNGVWPPEGNVLEGRVEVAGRSYEIPVPGDNRGLIPAFDPADFDRRWQCGERLAEPISHRCDPLPLVIDGTARETVELAAVLAALAESDARCGFSSAAVLAGAVTTGAPGGIGEVTWSIDQPCVLDFPARTFVARDCLGVETYVEGTARVRGVRRARGHLTGDPGLPVIPADPSPAVVELVAELVGFGVSTSSSAPVLTVQSGSLSGSVRRRNALDLTTGACTAPTQAADLAELTYDRARLRYSLFGLPIDLQVRTSVLAAILGRTEAGENRIRGTLTADGVAWSIPVDPRAPGLEAGYDRVTFEDRSRCVAGTALVEDAIACSYRRPLAESVARLLVEDVLAIGELAEGDVTCGFSSPGVLLQPVAVEGAPPAEGSVTRRVDRCTIDAGLAPVPEDCLRVRRITAGTATISGTLVTTGARAQLCTGFGCVEDARPTSPGGVVLALDATFGAAGFSAERVPAGAPSLARLTLLGGALAAEVVPVRGERASAPGVFEVPTPVATIDRLSLSAAPVLLEEHGRRFELVVEAAELRATRGAFAGSANVVTGYVVAGGERVELGSLPLDPGYDPARFDLGYDCTPDLAQPVSGGL